MTGTIRYDSVQFAVARGRLVYTNALTDVLGKDNPPV